MRIDDARQVLRIAASRQRQVSVDGEAVAALVADRLHARHAGLRQRRVQVGQLAQRVRGSVVQVSRARRAVVVGGDDELVLIAVRTLQGQVVAGQLGRQLLEQRFGLGVEELVLRLVGLVDGQGQHAAFARVGGRVQVDFLRCVDFFLDIGPGRVDDNQRQLVAASVGLGVELLVVEGEEGRMDAGAVVGGDQRPKFGGLVVAVKQGGVQAVAGDGGAQLAGMVGLPADDVAGIARHQLGGAAAHVDAVHVEDLRIALVVRDQHVVRIVLQVVDDAGAHVVVGRQVGDLAGPGVHRQDVEVLVAAEVLLVEHHVGAFPEEIADVARGFAGELARFAHERAAVKRLHEDVHARRAAVRAGRLHEAQRLAVFGQAEVAALGVAEEVLQRIARRLRGAGAQRGAQDAGGEKGVFHERNQDGISMDFRARAAGGPGKRGAAAR